MEEAVAKNKMRTDKAYYLLAAYCFVLGAVFGVYLLFNFNYWSVKGVVGIAEYLLLAFPLLIIAMGCISIAAGVHYRKKLERLSEAIRGLSGGVEGLSPADFLRNKGLLQSGGDYTGIYIIHNLTKNMYYVGQSVKVLGRLSQHFSGRGNGDVYADYKCGDDFMVKTVPLSASGYDSLDALERDAISAYDAYGSGYNRTRGNSN